jgi:hypothetical protein
MASDVPEGADRAADDPRVADLAEIVSGQCYGVHGGRQLGHLASCFHLRIRDLGARSALSTMPGFTFTFRSLQFACRTMQLLSCTQGVPPVRALVWGLLRSYSAGAASADDKLAVLDALRDVLRHHIGMWAQQRVAFVIESEPRVQQRRGQASDPISSKVSACVASVERVGVSLLTCLLQNRHLDVLGDPSDSVTLPLADAAAQFLSCIVLPLQPTNSALALALAGLSQGSLPVRDLFSDASFLELGASSGAYSMAYGFDQPLLLEDMQKACIALIQSLVMTIQSASILDASGRSSLLERVEQAIHPFEVFLQHPGIVPLSHGDRRDLYNGVQGKVLSALAEVKYFCSQRHLLSCLSHEFLMKRWQEVSDVLNREDCRQLGWALQRELAQPLVSVPKARKTLQHLRRAVPGIAVEAFESLSSAVLWSVCLWRVELELFSRGAFKAAALSVSERSAAVSVDVLEFFEAQLRAEACLAEVRDIANNLKRQLEAPVIPREQVDKLREEYRKHHERKALALEALKSRMVRSRLRLLSTCHCSEYTPCAPCVCRTTSAFWKTRKGHFALSAGHQLTLRILR